MIFDIYVPLFNLAFEYQGYHHFNDHYVYGNAKEYNARDIAKREVCDSLGLTLIEIPYWWHHDKESIMAIIHKSRPNVTWNPGNIVPFSKSSHYQVCKKYSKTNCPELLVSTQ